MLARGWLILVLAAVFWIAPPIERIVGSGWDHAAWAKGGSNSGSGSGNSGSGSSGSGNSGSGSSGSNDDDDDPSGSGGGSSGHGGSVRGASGPQAKGMVGSTDGGLLFTGGGGIHVQYADGRIERIRESVYEALDRRGKLVERHQATGQERHRMMAMETSITRDGRQRGLLVVVEIDERAGRAETTDFRGWRETMSNGHYTLSDPDGRTVTRRGLMATDVARLRTMLFLD